MEIKKQKSCNNIVLRKSHNDNFIVTTSRTNALAYPDIFLG